MQTTNTTTKNTRARGWVFTINNWTPTHEEALRTLDSQYIVWGREVGATGTPHLQGFVQLKSRYSRAKLSKQHGMGTAHLELAKGTPQQAADYCKKDGNYTERGSLQLGQGRRTDLESLKKSIDDGANISMVVDQHWGLYLRYERSIRNAILLKSTPRTWVTTVRVFYGQTGTGKTTEAWKDRRVEDVFIHPGDKWFDGYDGQPLAIFDDFGGSEFKLTYLLKLLDSKPMRVPIKGGYVQWAPKEIILTSNYHPNDWYPNAKSEHVSALKRRFTEIREFIFKQ